MGTGRLDISYSRTEDRLLLVAADRAGERSALVLTRRLTRAVAGALVELLMKTSPEISRSTPDHRQDILLFEHLNAISAADRAAREDDTPAPTPDTPHAPADDEVAPALLYRVDIKTTETGMTLRLSDAEGSRANLALSRSEVHQLVGILAAKATEAGWDLGELGWIDRRAHLVVPDRATVS